MEQLIVFYRIFHADLSPTIAPTLAQKKEYKEFLTHYLDMPGYPVYKDTSLLADQLLRYRYYEILLHKTVKEIEAELYQKVFVRGGNEQQMKSEVIRLQRYINLHLFKIRNDFIPIERQEEILQFSEARDAIDIYKLAYKSLVDLHEYLEATFRHYLDEHIVVPCKIRKHFIQEQKPNAVHVLTVIRNSDLHPKLKELVGGTIERFLADGFNGFTYAQMKYCAKLNKELNQFFTSSGSKTEKEFMFLLVQINFNRNGVLQYIMEFTQLYAVTEESYCKQLDILSDYLKNINRIQHDTSFAYDEKLLALKEQLVEWLEQKIHTTSLKNIQAKDYLGKGTEPSTESIEKYRVNLSVPESALLLRLLKKTNVVDMSKEKLFEHFSTHFYTKQAPNISTSSLGKKYHSPSEKNLQTVRDVLQQCLSHLDELAIQLQE